MLRAQATLFVTLVVCSSAAAQELRIVSVSFPQPTCIDWPTGSACDTGEVTSRQECYDPPLNCIQAVSHAQAQQTATGVEAMSTASQGSPTRVDVVGEVFTGFLVPDGMGGTIHPEGTHEGVSEMHATVMVVPSSGQASGAVEVTAILEYGVWAEVVGDGEAESSGTLTVTGPDGSQLVMCSSSGCMAKGNQTFESDDPVEMVFDAAIGDTFSVVFRGAAESTTSHPIKKGDPDGVGQAKSAVILSLDVAPNCVDIGSVTLCADEITETSSDVFSLSGNVTVALGGEVLLELSGTVTANKNNATVSGSGSAVVPDSVFPELGALTLYSGDFDFSVAGATLNAANSLLSTWTPGGLELSLTELEFAPGTLRVGGMLQMPTNFGSVEVEATARFDAQGVQFESAGGCFTVDELVFKDSDWKQVQVCVTYVWRSDTFTATFMTEYDDLMTMGSFTIVGGELDSVEVTSDTSFTWGPAVAFLGSDSTFGVSSIGVSLENLSQPGRFRLKGDTQIAVGPSSSFLFGGDILSGDLTITYSEQLKLVQLQGLGKLFRPPSPVNLELFNVTFDGFPIGTLEASYAPLAGFSATGWLDIGAGLVRGDLSVSSRPGFSPRGGGVLVLTMPAGLPAWMNPGGTIYGVNGTIDPSGLKLCFAISLLEVCGLISPNGSVDFGSNWSDLFGGPLPLANFTNPTDGAALLVLAEWTSGTTDFLLTAPGGTVYDSANLPAGPVTFTEAPGGLSGWFHVPVAASGSWSIDSYNDTTSGLSYSGMLANIPPSVEVTEAAAVVNATVGQPLAVPFDAFDPDDQAALRFVLVTKPEGEMQGFELASVAPVLETDGAGVAQLDLPADLRPGSYWLQASIDDGVNGPRTTRALARYEVANPSLLPAPQNVMARPQLNHIEVTFDPPATGSPPIGYEVEMVDAYAPHSEAIRRSAVADQSTVRVFTAALQPGTEYRVRVAAIDDQNRVGASSEPVVVPSPAPSGSAPRVLVGPPSLAPASTVWSAEVHVSDPDGGPLTIAVDPRPDVAGATLPTGLSWSETGPGVWTIELDGTAPAGLHPMRMTVTDGGGLHAELDWTLLLQGDLALNSAPEVLSVPAPRVLPGSVWTYEVSAYDVDEPGPLSLELLEAPAGTQLSGDTLTLPTDGSLLGAHTITLRAIDAQGADAVQTLLLVVGPEPPAPRYSLDDGGNGDPIDHR